MNRISLAHEGETDHTPEADKKPKKQSHIRQARPQQAKELPTTGPMAEMLKKLFKNND